MIGSRDSTICGSSCRRGNRAPAMSGTRCASVRGCGAGGPAGRANLTPVRRGWHLLLSTAVPVAATDEVDASAVAAGEADDYGAAFLVGRAVAERNRLV